MVRTGPEVKGRQYHTTNQITGTRRWWALGAAFFLREVRLKQNEYYENPD